MELKKPLTFEEQLESLRGHGIIINDDAYALALLHRANYYKLTGYTLQFRINQNSSDISGEHTIEEIGTIFQFDCDLRSLLRKYLEITELYFKTQISNSFALEKCLLPPHDQHYDEANYYYKEGFQKIMSAFEREEGYYEDSLIVRHHRAKYEGKMPLWVMMELMSFSNVSKLYSAMYISSQELIASNIHVGRSTLANHLHCLSNLRNKCSHGARLYNSNFNPPARLSSHFLQKNPSVNNSSLFAYVLVLLWRLPTQKQKETFKKDLFFLLDKYGKDIDLALIGFPENYKNIL